MTIHYSGDPVNTIMEDQHLSPQHTTPDVPVVRMPNFWPHAATCWFTILEAQFKLHRITRQELQYAILGQWLTEEVAIEVSDVILGPPSETPYDDLKDDILRRSHPRTAGRVTSLLPQHPAVPRLSEFVTGHQKRMP